MGKLLQYTSAMDSIVEEWPRESRQTVQLLADLLSQSEGERVSVVSLPTSWAFAASIACIWRANMIGSAISTASTDRETTASILATKPAIAIHIGSDKRFGADTHNLGPIHGYEIAVTRLQHDEAGVPLYDDSDAWIAGTSGSTGSPKQALFTQSAIAANAAGTIAMQGLSHESVACLFTPAHFGYGLNQTVSSVLAGATLAFWSDGLASPRSLRDFLSAHQVTHVSANPTSFRLLLRGAEGWRHEPMRAIVSGGQPLDRKLANQLRSTFPQAALYSGYGITENVNRVSFKRYGIDDDLDFQVALVGKPIVGTEVMLVDPWGTRISTPGQRGEIVVSGASLMRRYLGEDASQDISLFATGDLAEYDNQGDMLIVGRKKTAINVGNEMVVPEEVESMTLELPGVMECAVVGIVDELLGEALIALVEVEDAQSAVHLSAELERLWRTGLSRAKRPVKHWIVPMGTIPRTSYGKIDRARLRLVSEGMQ